MEKTDARKLSKEAQQQIRNQAIRLKMEGKPVRRYQRLPVFINQQLPGGTKLMSEKVPMPYESRKEGDARVVVAL